MRKQVYISADYSETDGDKDVIILGSDPLTIFLQNVDSLKTCALGAHYI